MVRSVRQPLRSLSGIASQKSTQHPSSSPSQLRFSRSPRFLPWQLASEASRSTTDLEPRRARALDDRQTSGRPSFEMFRILSSAHVRGTQKRRHGCSWNTPSPHLSLPPFWTLPQLRLPGREKNPQPPHPTRSRTPQRGWEEKNIEKKKVLSGLESSDLVSAAAAARRGLRRLACAPPGSPHPSPLPRSSVPWDASASGPRAPASEVFPLSIPKRARASCVRVGTQHRACSTLPIWRQHSTPLAPATAPAPASTGAVWCFQKQGEVCKRLSFLSVFSVGEGGWVWRGWAEEAWRVAGCFTREHHTHTHARIFPRHYYYCLLLTLLFIHAPMDCC